MNEKSNPRNLRDKLRKGEVVFGVFCKTTSPEMIECLGYAGFDFWRQRKIWSEPRKCQAYVR